MTKQTQKQKLQSFFKQLLPMEALFNVASPESQPYSFEDKEFGYTCRICNGKDYGDLGGGYLVYLCNLRSYKRGKYCWHTYLVNWERKIVKEVVMKNVLFLD